MKKGGFLIAGLFLFFNINAQDGEALALDAIFTGDVVGNFGGLKNGATSLGLMNMLLTFETEKANLWKGGIVHLNTQSLLGGHPSEEFIGDAQIVSNIEGHTEKFIYEAWYKQQLGSFSILFGLHNMNADFFVSSNAGLFINSSFGVGALLSMNHGVSIFPITTLGTVVSLDAEPLSIHAGLYNHGADFIEEESFQLKNHFFRQGFIGIVEMQMRPEGWGSEFKIGATLRACRDDSLLNNTIFIKKYNRGCYFLADQDVVDMGSKSISLFIQVGYYPYKFNPNPLFFSFGANVKGLFTGRECEELGVAFLSARINDLTPFGNYSYLGNESVFEVTGRYPVNNNISIHPDLQFVFNPSGLNSIDDVVVGIMRLEMNF